MSADAIRRVIGAVMAATAFPATAGLATAVLATAVLLPAAPATAQAPSSWEANVRPVVLSVKRIGSRLTREYGERLSAQVAVAGVVKSLKAMRRVWLPAS